jgi:hypothetical protein
MVIKKNKVKEIEKFLEKVSWQEFEKTVSYILEENNFETKIHFRFRTNKMWEIDIVAEGLVNLAIECKKLGKNYYRKNKLMEGAKQLKTKVKELEKIMNKKFIPVVVTLWEEDIKKVLNVYFVPVYALDEFLKNLTP